MQTVRQLINEKGSVIWSVSPDDTVFQALELMAEKNIGAVLVMEGSKLAGIFSERDYARKVILKGRSSRNTPVRELMTQRLYKIRPDRKLQECMQIFTEKKIRHLPVMEEDQLLGLVTIGDVVKAVISQQADTIAQLDNYISGRPY